MKLKNVNFGNITQSSVLYSSIYVVYSYIECFRHRMSHDKKVIRITVSDNPNEKAPQYPGMFRQNNKQGTILSRQEWLKEQTHKWVQHMSVKPAYTKTYLSDKALVLLSHLSNTLITVGAKSNKKYYPLCKKLIITSEGRLSQEENKGDIQSEVDDGGELMEKAVYDTDENGSDDDWSPDHKRRMRTRKEFELEKLLDNSDDELFKDENMEKIESLKQEKKLPI